MKSGHYGRRVAREERKVPVSQLVGAAEIAERLGAHRPSTVHVWVLRYPEFPAPIARLKGAHIWDWADVERWARATGRLDEHGSL